MTLYGIVRQSGEVTIRQLWKRFIVAIRTNEVDMTNYWHRRYFSQVAIVTGFHLGVWVIDSDE